MTVEPVAFDWGDEPEPTREPWRAVLPAPVGWWAIFRVSTAAGKRCYVRSRVAAFADHGDHLEALVADGGSCLVPASVAWGPGIDVELAHDDDLQLCGCGRRKGEEPDVGWCESCPGVIGEGG